MTYKEFEEIYKVLLENNQTYHEFVDQLPTSISSAFFDNEMVESFHKTIEKLCDKLFVAGTALCADVNYFLYDYKMGWRFIENYKEYNFKTNDDILEYFKERYFTEPDDISVKSDTGC